MKYHSRGQIFEFKTEYICKIIDYGRNYVKINANTDTKTILKTMVCNANACTPYCGDEVGYSIIQGRAYDINARFYDIYPDRPNVSLDLRFANMINPIVVPHVTKKIVFTNTYGTPQNESGSIHNVTSIFDLLNALELYIGAKGETRGTRFNSYKQVKKYGLTQTVTDEHGVNTTKPMWTEAAVMEIFDDGRDYTYTVTADA